MKIFPRWGRLLAAACAFALLSAPAAAAADTAAASVMELSKTEGTVGVSESSGKSLTVIKDMRLYNGYHVLTKKDSYAWIGLDRTKTVKLDTESEVDVRKSGKNLELLVTSGNLFYNITKPLETDETLQIRTSTMVIGIRGTSGWLDLSDPWRVKSYVIDGVVQCSVSDPVTGQAKTAELRAGQLAECRVYPQEHEGDKCDILFRKFGRDEIPAFVLQELAQTGDRIDALPALPETVPDEDVVPAPTNTDTPAGPPAEDPALEWVVVPGRENPNINIIDGPGVTPSFPPIDNPAIIIPPGREPTDDPVVIPSSGSPSTPAPAPGSSTIIQPSGASSIEEYDGEDP